jgi:RNA polymerase-binding transcription factor DksA
LLSDDNTELQQRIEKLHQLAKKRLAELKAKLQKTRTVKAMRAYSDNEDQQRWATEHAELQARIEKQDETMLAYESRIQRLDAALAEAQKSFERITEVDWGYDGDCGSANIAECAIMDIEEARAVK